MRRKLGSRPALLALAGALAIAGLFFAADLVLWHHAIAAVGAGLATVIANTQVVIVGLTAWVLLGERPSGRPFAAWLLITASLPRLPAAVSSVLLTVQPAATVLLAILIVDENPSFVQLAGVLVVIAGVAAVAGRRQPSERSIPT